MQAYDLRGTRQDGYAVQTVASQHTVRFVPLAATLEPGEAARLRTFLPLRTAQATISASGPLAVTRMRAVAETLRAAGVATVNYVEGVTAEDEVRVAVARDVVTPYACLRADGELRGPLPPGCAVDLTLARAVEDPRDLLRGRTLGPAPAAPLARAASAYLGVLNPAEGTDQINGGQPSVSVGVSETDEQAANNGQDNSTATNSAAPTGSDGNG